MSSAIEFGTCEICGKEAELIRTYFDFEIKCDCHSPTHFELVRTCNECTEKVKEPYETKVTLNKQSIECLSSALKFEKAYAFYTESQRARGNIVPSIEKILSLYHNKNS